MRVHELAKELSVTSKKVIEILKDNDIAVKGHMSSVSSDAIAAVKGILGKDELKQKPDKVKKEKKVPKEKPEKKHEKKVAEETPVEKPVSEEPSTKVLDIETPISVKNLSGRINIKPNELIAKLMALGIFASLNQKLDAETTEIVVHEYGFDLLKKEHKKEPEIQQVPEESKTVEEDLLEEIEDRPEDLKPHPPVVAFLGHVDHGKTTLLDYIRKTKVVAGEHGGITQHIGAYRVHIHGASITFLDTPGHEAFTAMRARGANITDIVVLVIAADDGIMPQTIEAINHSKAAGVTIMVAITKIDKPDVDIDRVKRQLTELELMPEDWGGELICCPVSGITGEGVEHLLEMIPLQAEVLDLKANPNRPAQGTVIEAKLTKDKGPIAVVLVEKGTLRRGDYVISGLYYGKVKALIDEHGKMLKEAGPSVPVEILGLAGVPEAGSDFRVVADEKQARAISQSRASRYKFNQLDMRQKITLENLYDHIRMGSARGLKLVLKSDVQGSMEALVKSLEAIDSKEVKLNIIHSGIGDINESDIMLAAASDGIVIGFHLRVPALIKEVAKREGVEIRTYNVIYNIIEDVRLGLEGLLEPEEKETINGHVEVRQVFKISKVGNIAGCYVTDGYINRNSKIRVLRGEEAVFVGKVKSLKRFKDEVKEVKSGFECGISLEGFNDIKEKDIIESYAIEKVSRKL
ncbi:MAG: translation initiation factor IF-2 [Candidatus Auribacterota bacterium]|nr:translation initiation factor IF-2 [Candidatus Auribacterota bacterium]